MMHIAYVCTDPGIPVFGSKGASIHVQEMLRAFLARGAKVTLLSPRIEGERPADLVPLSLIPLPAIPASDAACRARAVLELNGHVTASLANMGSVDIIYERHSLYAHAAMEFAVSRNIPGLLEVNAPLLEEQIRHRTLALADEAQASVRRAMTAAASVIAVSPAVQAYCLATGASTVTVVPNAVSPERFPLQTKVADPPFTLGFVGSLKPWHDVSTAIEALALLRAGQVADAQLLIVGDGPERRRLKTLAAHLDLAAATRFVGAVSPVAVPGQLARMHVGLAPYAADAGFYFSPLKLYEYMAAALPVVASDVGHLSTVVEHGVTGVLTPAGDAAALASALTTLALDPGKRTKLGTAARADVMSHRTWAHVAGTVFEMAQQIRRAAA